MKNLKKISTVVIMLTFFASTISAKAQTESRQFYQLKTYLFSSDEQVAQTDAFLKDAYLPALKRLGINNVGVFKLKEVTDSVQKIFVLIPFSSLEDFAALDGKLTSDAKFQKDGKDYITTSYDKQPYIRIQSILLKAFEDMPMLKPSALTGNRKDRVYELRSYQSPTVAYHKNKVKMFNQGGEVALFKKLKFNAVFYSEVLSGPDMPNLMYMTTFENQESRDAHWKSFGDAPEWKKLSALPEYQNNVSRNEQTFLYPTEYSDY
ncbi:MAG: NIPSNAP family protein [Leeuwenhoekiella sp.]